MSVETRPGEETSVLRARRRSMPRPGDLARRLERAIGEGFGRRRAQPFDSALRLLVVAFALWQFVDLVHRSAAEYADYSLTVDFGIANQAWWALGHGNLNPFDTLYGHPLWQEQFPLTFWLVALLNLFSTSPFTLLVFQDACIATATLLAGWWITDAVSRRLSPRRLGAAAVVLASLVALVWNPWALETAYFDYHNEPLGLVFLLGAGRALWNHRRRSPYVWAVLGALTCTASALLVGGLGLAAACFVTPRRRALGVAAIGFVTTVVVIVIGADKGTALGPTYGYLAAGHPVANDFSGGLAILSGIVHHPGEVTSELWSRRDLLNPIFQAGGIIGILSGWGLGVALFDVVPNGLNSGPSFISIQSGGFQNFPATVVLVVGSALVVVALLSRARPLWGVIPSVVVRLAGVALGVGALVSSLTLAAQVDPGVAGFWLEVYPPGASTLGQLNATIPVDDEVVVSQGVVGRFADRPYVYAYDSSPETIRLVTRRVWFVITPAMGQETVTAPSAESAIARLVSVDHGTQVLAENGTWVIVVDRARVPRATLQLP